MEILNQFGDLAKTLVWWDIPSRLNTTPHFGNVHLMSSPPSYFFGCCSDIVNISLAAAAAAADDDDDIGKNLAKFWPSPLHGHCDYCGDHCERERGASYQCL